MLDALMITFGIASVGIYLPFIIAVGSARKELPKLAPEYSSRLFSGTFEQYNPVWMIFLFSERVPERARVWVTPIRVLGAAYLTCLAVFVVCLVLAW